MSTQHCLTPFLPRGVVKVPRGVLRWGFSGGSDEIDSACKESALQSNAGDPGSIPRSGRSPGEENGNPLQYSCLENSMDRRA